MATDWRNAYAIQARSDFSLLKRCLKEYPVGASQCDIIHYLQMVTEKISKALTTSPAAIDPPLMKHFAFVSFVILAKRNLALQKACGFNHIHKYKAYLRSLMPIADEIEKLYPRKDRYHQNSEYPWQNKLSQQILAPAEDSFDGYWTPSALKVRKLQDFIESCFKIL